MTLPKYETVPAELAVAEEKESRELAQAEVAVPDPANAEEVVAKATVKDAQKTRCPKDS